jgi:hypothetical protein
MANDNEQVVLTSNELDIVLIAERMQEIMLDEFAEYPANILLAACMYNVFVLSSGTVKMTWSNKQDEHSS